MSADPGAAHPAEAEGFRQVRYQPPATATTVLLVRHGASEPAHPGRPFPLVDGHGDPPLDPTGHAQAARLAERLGRERVDAIYVTNLRRTSQTAQPLAERLGLALRMEAGLREVFLGEWEGGLIRAKAAAGDPVYVKMHETQRWDAIPGAEPYDAFHARTHAALLRIAHAHVGQRVVAVTHGGVIAQLLHAVTQSRPFAFMGAENTSISELVVDGHAVTVRRFNDTTHLDH